MTLLRTLNALGLYPARHSLHPPWFAVLAGLLWASAGAQTLPLANNAAAPPVLVACPTPLQLQAPQLHGLWRVQFINPPRGLPLDASLLLERDAEFRASLAGVVNRDLSGAPGAQVAGHASRAFLAGDLEEGTVTLDESSNGINITATWNAEVVAGSCGQEIKGVWKDTSEAALPDAPDVAFTLVKLASW